MYVKKQELLVIVKARELFEYVVEITEKAAKRFRVAFSGRMQNYCLNIMEDLVTANYTHLEGAGIKKRKDLQHEAFVQIKVLSYLSYTAQSVGVITFNQYEKLSRIMSETNKLLIGWGKADNARIGDTI
jgi:hypothetical protein